MQIKASLGTFDKRIKSTKVPSSTILGGNYNLEIKDRCSVEYPVFIFNFDPININYIYVVEWDRYYYKIDAVYAEGLWEVKFQEDYLASFKGDISATTAMILYAFDSSEDIVDSRIPVKSGVEISHKEADLTGVNWYTSGTGQPVLSITGKGSNGIYAVAYHDVLEMLDGFDGWYGNNVADYFEAIKQLAYGGSAMDNIKGAFSLPYTISSGISTENLVLGGYPCLKGNGTAITGKRLGNLNHDATCEIEIPWKYSDWRRSSPYSLVKIFLPLCGLFSINTEDIKNDSSLDVKYTLCDGSGDFSVTVKGHTSKNTVITSSGNCAMGLFLGSAGADIGKITTGVGGGIAAAIAGGAALAFGATGAAAVGAALAIGGGIAGAAGSTIEGLGGLTDGSGGLSGGAAINMGTQVQIFVVSKTLSEQPALYSQKLGKPYFQNDPLGNHSGYIQCDGFQLSSKRATSSEIEKINALCNTGIYME